ncbi:MAG: putative beta-lysine N-acetyltransferase [Firmicutes bacterium]|nr:putative beta-lysine N-acetyltransferase [Bacillota bacterium]
MQLLRDSYSSEKISLCGKSVHIEPTSKRIKIYGLKNIKHFNKFITELRLIGNNLNCDKLIFYVTKTEEELIKKYNCSYEGFIEGFFNGNNAYIYSIFLVPSRNKPYVSEEEAKVMDYMIRVKKNNGRFNIPKGFKMRWAIESDALQMAKLYDKVFESYPTPMNKPDFIIEMMNNDVYFSVVERNNEIVSACSADVLPHFNSAELSDCATDSRYRSKQLLSHQVSHLISLMKIMEINTIFSYSRSVSIGMNLVNVKHNFKYGGRMIANSNIAGRLENMNIWYKNIK